MPIVVVAKILVQDLWKLKADWNAEVPLSYADRWREIEASIARVTISIPRWLAICPSVIAVELHGFSDASQAALEAVVYVRVLDDM